MTGWYGHPLVLKLRQHLALVAAAWICLQIAGISAPLAMLHPAVGTLEVLCTCDGDDHGTCPMHRSPTSSTDADAQCRLQDACTSGDEALFGMTWIADLTPRDPATQMIPVSPAISCSHACFTSHAKIVDPPPPRA